MRVVEWPRCCPVGKTGGVLVWTRHALPAKHSMTDELIVSFVGRVLDSRGEGFLAVVSVGARIRGWCCPGSTVVALWSHCGGHVVRGEALDLIACGGVLRAGAQTGRSTGLASAAGTRSPSTCGPVSIPGGSTCEPLTFHLGKHSVVSDPESEVLR